MHKMSLRNVHSPCAGPLLQQQTAAAGRCCQTVRSCLAPVLLLRALVAQGLHAAGIVHAPDGFAQEVCHRQDGELWEHILRSHWDGVGHNDFTEHPAAEALNGWRAEHCVAGAGIHLRVTQKQEQAADCLSATSAEVQEDVLRSCYHVQPGSNKNCSPTWLLYQCQ